MFGQSTLRPTQLPDDTSSSNDDASGEYVGLGSDYVSESDDEETFQYSQTTESFYNSKYLQQAILELFKPSQLHVLIDKTGIENAQRLVQNEFLVKKKQDISQSVSDVQTALEMINAKYIRRNKSVIELLDRFEISQYVKDALSRMSTDKEISVDDVKTYILKKHAIPIAEDYNDYILQLLNEIMQEQTLADDEIVIDDDRQMFLESDTDQSQLLGLRAFIESNRDNMNLQDILGSFAIKYKFLKRDSRYKMIEEIVEHINFSPQEDEKKRKLYEAFNLLPCLIIMTETIDEQKDFDRYETKPEMLLSNTDFGNALDALDLKQSQLLYLIAELQPVVKVDGKDNIILVPGAARNLDYVHLKDPEPELSQVQAPTARAVMESEASESPRKKKRIVPTQVFPPTQAAVPAFRIPGARQKPSFYVYDNYLSKLPTDEILTPEILNPVIENLNKAIKAAFQSVASAKVADLICNDLQNALVHTKLSSYGNRVGDLMQVLEDELYQWDNDFANDFDVAFDPVRTENCQNFSKASSVKDESSYKEKRKNFFIVVEEALSQTELAISVTQTIHVDEKAREKVKSGIETFVYNDFPEKYEGIVSESRVRKTIAFVERNFRVFNNVFKSLEQNATDDIFAQKLKDKIPLDFQDLVFATVVYRRHRLVTGFLQFFDDYLADKTFTYTDPDFPLEPKTASKLWLADDQALKKEGQKWSTLDQKTRVFYVKQRIQLHQDFKKAVQEYIKKHPRIKLPDDKTLRKKGNNTQTEVKEVLKLLAVKWLQNEENKAQDGVYRPGDPDHIMVYKMMYEQNKNDSVFSDIIQDHLAPGSTNDGSGSVPVAVQSKPPFPPTVETHLASGSTNDGSGSGPVAVQFKRQFPTTVETTKEAILNNFSTRDRENWLTLMSGDSADSNFDEICAQVIDKLEQIYDGYDGVKYNENIYSALGTIFAEMSDDATLSVSQAAMTDESPKHALKPTLTQAFVQLRF